MKKTTTIYLFDMVALIAMLFFCCKKQKNEYTIIYTGQLFANDTINFATTAPAGSTYLWDFGDTTTSTGATPSHVYNHSDTFTVTLIINGDADHAISTSAFINVNPGYTYLVGGTRVWHHWLSSTDPYSHTFNYIGDVSFTTTYINPITVAMGTDTLYFSGHQLPGDHTLVFTHEYEILGHPTLNGDDLTFNYVTDSLVFDQYRETGAGGSNNTDFYYWP